MMEKTSNRRSRGLLFIGLLALLGGGLWVLFSHRPWAPPGGRPGAPAHPLGKPEPILVDDFETGQTQGLFGERKNRLDAFQGTWARRPSYTVITKELSTRPGSAGNTLKIDYAKEGGWCGWYTLLNGIDVSKHNALTFWVKGERGGERFDVGLADDKMQDLEIDATYLGPITGFLPQGVTTQWQQVKIPLQGIRSDIDLSRMGSLVFWFRYEGKGAIQIDDVVFAYDEEVERIQRENAPRVKEDPRAPRAVWSWKHDPVRDTDVRQEMFSFFKQTAVRRLYLYLGEDPITRSSPADQKELARFLKECHVRGVEVHALQGNPLWALKSYHPRVVEWVGSFLEFNRGRPAEERMDGVHMDIEPYLTAEWETGDREKLKNEFLELLTQCRQMIADRFSGGHFSPREVSPREAVSRPWAVGPAAAKPFVMGLAIPLFYNREPEMEEKLLSLIDYAALMDYYDSARDIIEQGRPHLELAKQAGAQMVIGVETQDLVEMNQGKRRNTFVEEGWEEMERELAKIADAFAGHPAFDGLAIHAYHSYRNLQRGRNVPARERSGKVAPMTATAAAGPVTVDGDLGEWADAEWMVMDKKDQVVYGAGAWGWGQDLSFRVALRWEPKALLVAVDVTDDLHVQEKRGADMWEGDHLELWVDADLEGDFLEATNSDDDFQIGLSPGNFKELPPEVHVWVPSVDPASMEQVELAAKPKAAGYTMEVRLPTSFLFQNVMNRVGVEPGPKPEIGRVPAEALALQNGVLASGEFKAGFRMGLMVDGSDCDAAHQPQKCMLSSSQERQWGDPTTFNILELK